MSSCRSRYSFKWNLRVETPSVPVVAAKLPPQLKFLSLNVACLPHFKCFGQINREFLRPNQVRVQEIAAQIKGMGDGKPDVLCFQEAFDSTSQSEFIAQLRDEYPYVIHQVGHRPLNAGSGLMVFSRYPILDTEFHRYTDTMVGEETLANKGFLACKIQVAPDRYVTVYNTHTQSGGALLKSTQSKLTGTTSMHRGFEFGRIAEHMERYEKKPIERASPGMKQFSTHLMGDVNTNIDCDRTMLSVSTGLSSNGFKRQDVKYPGQYQLFKRFYPTTPTNHRLSRPIFPNNLEEKQSQSQPQAGVFIGTVPKDETLRGAETFDGQPPLGLKEPIPLDAQSPSKPKIIDACLMGLQPGILPSQDTPRPEAPFFSTLIVPFGNSTDHYGVVGTLDITRLSTEIQPNPAEHEHPSDPSMLFPAPCDQYSRIFSDKNFFTAYSNLLAEYQNIKEAKLRHHLKLLMDLIQMEALRNGRHGALSLERLTTICLQTCLVIQDPKVYVSEYTQLGARVTKRNKAVLVGAALLALAGIAIIAVSIAATIFSIGAFAPVAVALGAVGGGMIASATAGIGIGTTVLAGSAFVAYQPSKQAIRKKMEAVSKASISNTRPAAAS